MRLLTYNIHSGIGGRDRRYSLDRIAAMIAGENPDLICLQEVDCNVPRSGHDDQPTLLGRELKAVASFYQLNVPQGGGGYGNLVLSRWPFRQQYSVSLTRPWSRPRGAQLVVVQTPDGPLHLVNWHLSLSERDRRWQANHLLAHPLFLKSAHLPTLIVGDSNDWLDILEGHCFHHRQFQQATAPSSRFRSFPAFVSLVSLDKVFYRGALQVQEVRIVGSLLARQASDHRPLVLGFQLQAPVKESAWEGEAPAEPGACGSAGASPSRLVLQLQPHPEQPPSSSSGKCAPAAPPRSPGFGWRRALIRAVNQVRTPISNFWAEVQAIRRGDPVPTPTSPAPVPPASVSLPVQNLPAIRVRHEKVLLPRVDIPVLERPEAAP